jgi:hypothetical protein
LFGRRRIIQGSDKACIVLQQIVQSTAVIHKPSADIIAIRGRENSFNSLKVTGLD